MEESRRYMTKIQLLRDCILYARCPAGQVAFLHICPPLIQHMTCEEYWGLVFGVHHWREQGGGKVVESLSDGMGEDCLLVSCMDSMLI